MPTSSAPSPTKRSGSEEPLFFPNGDGQLFGVLHLPPSSVASSLPIVFCHAFAEEKLWTHRVFVTFARKLASRGHAVLRFDYRGNGDSSGEFSESSLESALSDVARAIEFLKARTGAARVGLLGLRFGATVASRIADTRSDVSTLVLWSPIVDGARYMQELLRVNLGTQMTVYREIRHDREDLLRAMKAGSTANADGYEMSLPMFEQVSAIKLAEAPMRFDGRCLIVRIERQLGATAQGDNERLHAQYRAATLVTVQEDPFWKEVERFYDTAPNLFAATLTWLDAHD
jgi:uncharacterized protein